MPSPPPSTVRRLGGSPLTRRGGEALLRACAGRPPPPPPPSPPPSRRQHRPRAEWGTPRSQWSQQPTPPLHCTPWHDWVPAPFSPALDSALLLPPSLTPPRLLPSPLPPSPSLPSTPRARRASLIPSSLAIDLRRASTFPVFFLFSRRRAALKARLSPCLDRS